LLLTVGTLSPKGDTFEMKLGFLRTNLDFLKLTACTLSQNEYELLRQRTKYIRQRAFYS
jgi:hypothetical protein